MPSIAAYAGLGIAGAPTDDGGVATCADRAARSRASRSLESDSLQATSATIAHPADHAFVCASLLGGSSGDARRGIRSPALPEVPGTTASSQSLRSLPESDQTVRNKTPARSRLDVRGSSPLARRCRYPPIRSRFGLTAMRRANRNSADRPSGSRRQAESPRGFESAH